MSLILEALKKVERERQARESGTVIIGAAPWAEPRRKWWPMTAALVVTAGLGAAAAVFLRPASETPRDAPAPPLAAVPAAQPLPASRPPAPLPPSVAPLSAAGDARRAPATPKPATVQPAPLEVAVAPIESPPEPPPRAPARPDLRLQAISEQDGRPVAMLNDRLVREGDVVDGARVLRIGAAEIEVEVGGERRIIKF